jgi:5-methylcytosine-specific restriction endonuclease McrA
MLRLLLKLLGFSGGEIDALAALRSPGWKSVRREHLLANPRCIVCGSTRGVVPHHVVPFHVAPDRELDPSNLVTLCESPTFNCHLFFGHLKRWDRHNPNVAEDAAHWSIRITGGGSHP